MTKQLENFTDEQLVDELKKRKSKTYLVTELDELNKQIKDLEARKNEILKQLGK